MDTHPDRRVVVVLADDGPRVVAADAPIVAADDAGLTRGDGCFDSALVAADTGELRVVDLPGHLARLARSAAALEIDPPDETTWVALVDAALAAWTDGGEGDEGGTGTGDAAPDASSPDDASLKLVLTRGRESAPGRPTAFVVLSPRAGGRPQRGAAVATTRSVRAVTLSRGHPSDAFADAPWLLGGVKTLSYVVNAAAMREARRRGADDVIFTTTDGYALDAPMAGLLVVRDGALLTTPTGGTGILASTSIDRILAAAAADGRAARHELVPTADLARADGVWLVASSRGPTPVGELDGRPMRVDDALVADVARWAGF